MTYCNTPESFWNNSKEIDNLLVYGQWTRTNCSHCQRQCHQDFYIAYTEMTKMKPTENKISKLRVFYQVFFTEKSFLSLYNCIPFAGFHVWRDRRECRLWSRFSTLRYWRLTWFPSWLFCFDCLRDCRRHRSNLFIIYASFDQQMQRN